MALTNFERFLLTWGDCTLDELRNPDALEARINDPACNLMVRGRLKKQLAYAKQVNKMIPVTDEMRAAATLILGLCPTCGKPLDDVVVNPDAATSECCKAAAKALSIVLDQQIEANL